MGPVDPRDAAAVVAHRLTVMVDNLPLLRALSRRGTIRRPVPVHIKIRGGLHRWGVPLEDFLPFLQHLRRARGVRWAGVFAHPGYMAGKNGPAVERWLTDVDQRLRPLRADNPDLRWHVADSAVLLDFPRFRYRDVRVGNLLYGINPTDKPFPLKNPWRPLTRLVRVIPVRAGTSIGYGGVFQADRDMTLGVLPVGYGHGFTMELASPTGSKGYWVTVRGHRCPVVGRVGMSHSLVDLSAVPRPRMNEKVSLPLRRTASAVWEKIYR
jgi:alanine racemase